MANNKPDIKVLVADDEKIICDFFVRLLAIQGGLDIVSVKDGYEAVEAVKKTPFDLIFLDVKMPGMDGLETYRLIRKIDRGSRVVMMTGYAADDVLKTAQEEGAYGIIRKPFEIKEIRSIVSGISEDRTGRLNVLIVDDDEAILKFFSNFLKDKATKVRTVRNGADAVKVAQEEPFDIIFLDLMLEGIDGIDIYRTLKRAMPSANIVMITGYPQKGKEAAEILGIEGCLYKPFEIDTIITELDKARARSSHK